MPKVLGEPTPRFNLHDSSLTETFVILVFRYPYQGKSVRMRFSPGEKIKTKHWDFERQWPIKSPLTSKLIGKLSKLEAVTLDIYRQTGGDIPPKGFKQELNYRYLGHPRPEEEAPYLPTFLEFIARYVEQQQDRQDLTRGTWKVLLTWKNHLEAFSQETGKELTFEGINENFRQAFLSWCYDEKNHSVNYVAKGLDVVSQFMAAAQDAGLTENDYPQKKGWKLKKLPTPTIALSEEQLQAIFDLDLTGYQPGYQKARQLFLIGAYTGLRHSDYKRISRGHVTEEQGQKVISILAWKTKKMVTIPLHKNLEAILEEVEYHAPRLSSQKFNQYLKEIARLAGITEQRAVYTSAGGQVVEEFKPKHELISSHTARRTFATVALINGWPSPLIRAITGHSTEAQLHNYIDFEAYLAAQQVGQFYRKGNEGNLKAI